MFSLKVTGSETHIKVSSAFRFVIHCSSKSSPKSVRPSNLVLMATVANFETHTSFWLSFLMQVLTLFQLQITHFLWYLQYIHYNRKEAAGLISIWKAGRERFQHALNRNVGKNKQNHIVWVMRKKFKYFCLTGVFMFSQVQRVIRSPPSQSSTTWWPTPSQTQQS